MQGHCMPQANCHTHLTCQINLLFRLFFTISFSTTKEKTLWTIASCYESLFLLFSSLLLLFMVTPQFVLLNTLRKQQNTSLLLKKVLYPSLTVFKMMLTLRGASKPAKNFFHPFFFNCHVVNIIQNHRRHALATPLGVNFSN